MFKPMVVLRCAVNGRVIVPLRLNFYYHMFKQFPLYFPFRRPLNTCRAAMCTRTTVLCYGCVISELSSVVAGKPDWFYRIPLYTLLNHS